MFDSIVSPHGGAGGAMPFATCSRHRPLAWDSPCPSSGRRAAMTKRTAWFDHGPPADGRTPGPNDAAGGDVLDLIVHFHGGEQREALRCTLVWLGEVPQRPPGFPHVPAILTRVASMGAMPSTRGFAHRILQDANPAAGSSVGTYLIARVLPGVVFTALGFHPSARLPAILAAVCDPQMGGLRAVHRTFLRLDGIGKAAVEPAALRDDGPFVVAEGIEMALFAGRRLGAPAWSGNLAKRLALPATVRAVVIAADPDQAGQCAAWRWRTEGCHMRSVTLDDPETDFNNLCSRHIAASGEVQHENG